MNLFKQKSSNDEKISLDKIMKFINNNFLSQNAIAVTPNCQNWLFYCPKSSMDKAIPPYLNHPTALHGVGVCYSVMVWLILQNKPIGKYVKRLLLQPRVRPHRPFMGNLLKKSNRSFLMKTKTPLSHPHTAQTLDNQRPTALHGDSHYTSYVSGANAVYREMYAPKQARHDTDDNATTHHSHTASHKAKADEMCVTIPLSTFKSLLDDVECIKNALDNYDGILSVICHKKLSQRQMNSLTNNLFLASNIHSEIAHELFSDLLKHLPLSEQQHYIND